MLYLACVGCGRQMDVALILDLSGSVSLVRDVILEFAYEFVRELPVGADVARVSVITFSDSAQVNFQLSTFSNLREVLNALSFAPSTGTTHTQAALQLLTSQVFTRDRGDRPGVQNYGLVVSDGWSNINSEQTIPQAREARDNGIRMYSVIVGRSPNFLEMEGIANTPSTEFTVRLPNSGEINNAASELLSRLCR